MLEAAIPSLVDRLIQLLQVRDQNRRREFEMLIEPIFQDASTVAADYTKLFVELIARLNRHENLAEIIQWLELRRSAFLSVRIKLRSTIGLHRRASHGKSSKKHDRMPAREAFSDGIIGLLCGGLSLVTEGHVRIDRDYLQRETDRLEPLEFVGHTILDILYHCAGHNDPDSDGILRNAKEQQMAVERAWKEVCDAYAELRLQAYAHKISDR